jgi:serine/threonine protein kinase
LFNRYAPESLRDGKFSLSSDVWSYGVTLYEMFSLGEEPRLGSWPAEEETQQLLSALESGQRLSCPPHCSQSLYVQLLIPCWHADSHQRPTFSHLVVQLQQLLANS